MGCRAFYKKYILHFKQPAGTSRGVLKTKVTYFLIISHHEKIGIGECALFKGLSADDKPDYEEKLQWVCDNIQLGETQLYQELEDYPSIQIGIETAFKSFKAKNIFEIFPSKFLTAEAKIPINGLVWMGDKQFMNKQIIEKIKLGFTCIKLKIGALDFDSEIDLLQSIRQNFSNKDIEIRVDANGAFLPNEALEKLNILSQFSIHSIEQPIKQGQWQEMARLCQDSPIPIALDEELIGIHDIKTRENLLKTIQPQFIILKPSLVGGFKGSDNWITLAEDIKMGWWITSALESNIGLNAIAQYTYTKKSKLPQGLGTGGLFTNNITSPLEVSEGKLFYNKKLKWNLSNLKISNY